MTDEERGRQAVGYFHSASFWYSDYHESLDSLISKIAGGKDPQYFLDGLGTAIREIGMNQLQITEAMSHLASLSVGKIPKKELFFQALSNRISNPTAVDFIWNAPEIAGGTAADGVKVLQGIGNNVIQSAQFFTSPIGIAVLAGVAALVGLGYLKANKLI